MQRIFKTLVSNTYKTTDRSKPKLWTRLVTLIAFLTICGSVQAALTSAVDRNEVGENETFTLIIEIDELTSQAPDLSVLPAAIQELSRSSYRRASTINGVSEILVGWKIQLMIKEAGVYTIPAITLAGQMSQPITIKVSPSNSTFGSSNDQKQIMLTAELDQQTGYVQQQRVLTIKLFRARSIQTQYAKLSPSPFTIEDALVEPLGDDVQYEKLINGESFYILERKFAIFPQRSGKLAIPKTIFSADVLTANRGNGFGRLLGRTRPVTLSSEALELEVAPYPDGHTGTWLPAKNLSLDARWNDEQDKVVGEPATWTIKLTGMGLHENQLPEIDLPSVDGLKWYPDTPQKNRYIGTDGINSTLELRVAVVPTKAGIIELPAISIPWFNTETEQYETATLQPMPVRISPNPEQEAPLTLTSPESRQPSAEAKNTSADQSMWKLTAEIFIGLWILTFILWLSERQRLRHLRVYREKQILVQKTPKNVPPELNAAIKSNDPHQLYREIQRAIKQFSDAPDLSLKQRVVLLNDPDITKAIEQLEQAAFSKVDTSWRAPANMRKMIDKVIHQAVIKPTKREAYSLKPLYPH